MKKNLFFGLFATMVLLLTTACQQDEVFVDGNATVTFKVSTPEMVTRAYSDGTMAKNLQYHVYLDENGSLTYLDDLDGTATMEGNGATVSIDLATGKTYHVLFWAAANGAPYTVDPATHTMTVDYTGASNNDEKRDAFYSWHTIQVNNNEPQDVKLLRPFAQLNIGTDDIDEADKAGLDITQVGVTVSKVYTTLNFASGEVDGETSVEFGRANRPENENFPVQPETYKYLAMNYLLVSSTKSIADVEMSYDDQERTYTNIPLQRNHRTNIYGSLLTKGIGFNVEIEEGFDGDAVRTEAEKLIVAAQTGGTYTLTGDVVLTQSLHVTSDFELNLNGKTITGPAAAVDADGNRIHVIVNDGRLIVRGGTIKSVAENGGSAIMNNGILTLNDATIEGAPTNTATGTASYAVNTNGVGSKLIVNNTSISGRGTVGATNGTKVEINGGTYHTPAVAWGHAVYANGEGTEVVINAGTFSEGYAYAAENWGMYQIYAGNKAKVIVNGGDFSQEWDCANGYDLCTGTEGIIEIYGGTFAENPSAQNGKNYVAAGYTAIEKDGKWTVVAAANNAETLAAAFAKGGEVVLTGDITATEVITIPEGKTVVLDLKGKTVTATTTDAFVVSEGATLTISGNGKVESNGAPIRAIGGVVIVEGGEFTQTGAWNTAVSTYRYSVDSREGGEIIVKGGTFKTNNGMLNVSANSSIVIEGGNFEFVNNTGGTRHFAYVSGELTINDGVFRGVADGVAGGCFFCGAAAGCDILVNGGKFTSLWTSGSANRIFEAYSSGTAINVTGGLFNTNGGIDSFVEANTDTATKDAYPYKAK